ncbi:MAG: acyl-CoA reductase [Kiritimatiellae bacterium]|nr:acyl-CoA reductase [Kiritimatiellia bacterium]
MILSSVNNTPLRPFEPVVLDCLEEISATILKSPVGRQFPDLTAFAFYIRKANLQKIAASFKSDEVRLGRGLCFHVAPANIPINFAFTWMFSLLAGNANVVRLPSKEFPQVDALLKIINAALDERPELRERNTFVKYPRTDSETTAAYCQMADCRMIWGGDRTIASIKALPTKPRCVDIAFADRYSVAMIDGAALLAADEARLARLAQDFYNDTYLMDQNACSSPQVILWEVGDLKCEEVEKAKERFWDAVYGLAEKKYILQDAVAVDKYTLFCEEAVGNRNIKTITRRGNLLYRVELKSLPSDIVEHRGKAGFFFEYSLACRQEFFSVVTEKFQTITQFGIDSETLAMQIADAHLRGIDRIVPIGRAMDIGVVWDGHELVSELTRVVAC